MNSTMALLRGLAPILLGLVLILLGVLFAGIALGKINVVELVQPLKDAKDNFTSVVALYLAWAGCWILGVVWIWSAFGGRKEGTLECPSEGGRVLIQATTVKDLVRQIAESVPGVVHAQSQGLRQRSGITTVRVAITPDFSQPVSGVAAQVQDKIRKELERTLGIPAVQDVDVSILGKGSIGGVSRVKKSPLDDIKGDEVR